MASVTASNGGSHGGDAHTNAATTTAAAPVAVHAVAARTAAATTASSATGAAAASADANDATATAATIAATAPRALDIETLVKQNISTRRELEAWVLAQRNSLLREKAAHEQQTRDHVRQTHEAQHKREALQQQQKALAANVHGKESEISAHQVEIEVLQAEKSKKEPVLKDLFVRNQEEGQRLKHLVSEATELQTAQERQLAELQQGIAMYQRLGLFFEHTGAQQLVVRFTQIDPTEPNRVFSFRIRIDAVTDRFIVDECNEDVPAFDALVDALNDSGDLALFVRTMRRQFKRLV